MKKSVHILLLVVGALILSGCHESGIWKEDSKNWKRIFHTPKPTDVSVVHSQFYRSPHWTYEFEYFLQIKKNEEFQKTLFQLNKLKRLSTEAELRDVTNFVEEKPAWFLPKPISNYEVWVYDEEPVQHFRFFIDHENGDLFLTDFQL